MSDATVASIGSTHPWNIAGAGLDQRVGGSLSVRVLTVVAGVTAQDQDGLHAAIAVPEEIFAAQLRALPMAGVDAIRVGALISRANVELVAAFLETHERLTAVVDPVFGATLGGALLDDDAFAAFRDSIATKANVVLTPNLEEAQRLLGRATIGNDDLGPSAEALRARGANAVLVKGGHLAGDPVDALATVDGVTLYQGERIAGAMRGSGCALAMALACEIARGLPVDSAVDAARIFVRGKMAAQIHFGGLQVAY